MRAAPNRARRGRQIANVNHLIAEASQAQPKAVLLHHLLASRMAPYQAIASVAMGRAAMRTDVTGPFKREITESPTGHL